MDPRNFTGLKGLWTYIGCIFHSLAHKHLINKSRVVSCSLGPIGIMSLIHRLMWHIVKEKGDQNSCKLNYNIAPESWYVPEVVGQWRCIVNKLLLGVLIDRDGEKGICQINSRIPSTRGRVNLLKQWNHIWCNACNWSQHLVKPVIIHCHSPSSICILQSPNRCVEWGGGGNPQPRIFEILSTVKYRNIPVLIGNLIWNLNCISVQ